MTYFLLYLLLLTWLFYRYNQLVDSYLIPFDSSIQSTTKDSFGVSIIIPCRDDNETLDNLLASLEHQDYPTFEIIIIDDHSAQPIKRSHTETASISVFLNEGIGKKEAMELGIKRAKYDYLLFTDADTYAGTQWIASMMYKMINSASHMVTGPVACEHKNGLYEKYYSHELLAWISITHGAVESKLHPMANGANMLVMKSSLSENDPFNKKDSASGDDLFLSNYFFQNGALTYCSASEATVYTYAPQNFKSMLRQRLRWTSKNKFIRSELFQKNIRTISNLYMGIGFGAVFFLIQPIYALLIFASTLVVKSLIDYKLIKHSATFVGVPVSFASVLELQWFNILLNITVGVRSIFSKDIQWKNRKVH